MDYPLRILLVEDSETDSYLLVRFLKKEKINFSYSRVWREDDFVRELNDFNPDIIIADHSLPQFSGIDAFHIAKKKHKHIPFILVTGTVSEKILTQYMKEGIDDYIMKTNFLRMPSAIEKVINKKKIEKLNDELMETNGKLREVHTEIKDSISYAKRIQDAMLPDKSILNNVFPKSFVFFKPKHVLSGDFFWFEKKQDIFYVAVADCTGHGIPGALLSMMGNNLLYETLNIKNISQPSKILDHLNNQVRKTLKHDTSSIHDGMDITLCSFDVKNNIMMYAGANRPLYIIRERNLLEFKPDRLPIGSTKSGYKNYTNHTIDIKSGDMIFLFSDGFADQFNEKTNKKMTVKRLRELLTKVASLSLQAQEKIITAFFEEWKGDNEQIDDVLLIGIQIQ